MKSLAVVTPTFRRPAEVRALLSNLIEQTVLPDDVIIVDGAAESEPETQRVIHELKVGLPFNCHYTRSSRGTAIQRNHGIELTSDAQFVAFIDDDVRLEPDFLEQILRVFAADPQKEIGGIVGYRLNQSFSFAVHQRWRWYRNLRLLSTFEPGRYDFKSGYPINANGQPLFKGVRDVDFMTTACAVWRREVFDAGLRFDTFFSDYGILEDAHFSLRAGRQWKLLQCGDAHCNELHSPNGRVDRQKVGYKCVLNYYYVFKDIAQPLTWRNKLRFWIFQVFELLRIAASAIRRRRHGDWLEVQGRLKGFVGVMRGESSRRRKNLAI